MKDGVKMELVCLDTEELKIVESSKAMQIKKTFEPMVEMLAKFESCYDSIIERSKVEINEELIKEAKRLRLDIASIRTRTEKNRKK